jgi:hypothetical protein
MGRPTLTRRRFLVSAGALGAYPLLHPRRTSFAVPTATSASEALSLVNPRLAHPVFAEPGDSFNVEVATTRQLAPDGWSVQLSNDLGATWSCTVSGVSATGIDYDRQQGYRLRVQAPSSISPELFTLRVRHSALSGEVSEVRAVSIVPSLWNDCYLLHLTDEHVMYDSISHYACEDKPSGYRSADLVRWATPVVNLINPRLVVNSGDQAHQYATTGYRYNYNDDIYRCYLNAKRNYRVPSMMLLGNHEVHEKDSDQRARDWKRWEELAGRRAYHIRMGTLWFFAHDYLDEASRRFIDEVYRASFREGQVEGRVLVQHHTSWYGYRPGSELAPTVMLIGHLHRQSVEDRWPYPILLGAAAHKYATGSLVRFVRHDGRWTTDAENTWSSCDVRLVGSYGTPSVAASYAQPNDGRARSNQVTISNTLDQRFSDRRVRLILGEGRYSVRGGDVLSRYSIAGGKTAVLVRVDIPRKSTLRLEVELSTSTVSLPGTGAETEVPLIDETLVPLDASGAPLAEPGPADLVTTEVAPLDPGATDAPGHRPFTLSLPQVAGAGQ